MGEMGNWGGESPLAVEKSWIKQVGNKEAVFLGFSDIRLSVQPRHQSKHTPG